MRVTALWVSMTNRFRRTDDGASLVEYALLVSLIAIVCLLAIAFLGHNASTRFSSYGSSVGNAGVGG